MYKDIESFYKKNDPFAQFLKRLTIAYLLFLTFATICAVYKWYIVMLIVEVIGIVLSIIHIIHFSKVMPSQIKKKVFTVRVIDNAKEIFKTSEIQIFKKMTQNRNLYSKESLKCILEHYRLFISQKQLSLSFVSILSITLPILLSFYNNGSFNTTDLVNSLKYIVVFLIGLFVFYFIINSVINIKRLILGEDAMYMRLEEIFSELYVDCINGEKNKKEVKKNVKEKER